MRKLLSVVALVFALSIFIPVCAFCGESDNSKLKEAWTEIKDGTKKAGKEIGTKAKAGTKKAINKIKEDAAAAKEKIQEKKAAKEKSKETAKN